MTPKNRELNATDEFERAETCLEEARALAASNFPYGAASRAYYAVFHAARALLFSVGLEPRSHRGVISLFGEHFVKTGEIDSQFGRVLSHMQRDREDADYATGAVFTDQEAATLVKQAEDFLHAIEEHLDS